MGCLAGLLSGWLAGCLAGCCLESPLHETPTLGGKAKLSPAQPSRSEPIRADQKSTAQKKVASRLRETPTLGGKAEPSPAKPSRSEPSKHPQHQNKLRLVHTKHTCSKNCTLQRASRLRETHTSKIKCRLVYARRYFFEKQCVAPTPNTYFG